jgi:cobalt-zinc-cadmium efflux system outer membrane protein
MKHSSPRFLTGLCTVAAFAAAGCASLDSSGVATVKGDVASRTGLDFSASGPGPSVAALLSHPLDADSAALVALLANRDLAADFEDIGIGEADLARAVLIRNPILQIGLEFPAGPPSATRIDASISQMVIDLIARPRRQKVAASEFEAVRLRAADRALDLIAQVKRQVYRVQGDLAGLERLKAARDLGRASAELARLQYDAGNIGELEYLRRQAAFGDLGIEVAEATASVTREERELDRLLGVYPWSASISAGLPDVPAEALDEHGLQDLVVARRLDIAAARAHATARAQALGIDTDTRWAAGLALGADYERDTDGQRALGPAISAEIPIFDTGSVQVARGKAELRQAQFRLEALALNARIEVRQCAEALRAAQEAATAGRTTLIPTRQRIVELTQEHTNGMLLGAYDLIQAKQAEIAAERGEISVCRDYWVARAELERALSGNIPSSRPLPSTP